MRSRLPLIVAMAAGVGFTVFAAVLPGVRYAYRLPSLHVAMETAEALSALSLGYLALGRHKLQRLWSDFLLAQALILFGVTNLVLSALPRAALGGETTVLATWAPLVLRLVGAGVFALSAWQKRVADRERPGTGWDLVLLTAAIVGSVCLVLTFTVSTLPAGLDPANEDPTRPQVSGEPAIVTFQLISAGLFAAGALGFLKRSQREGDDLLGWVGAAAVLSAFARVNYALFPSIYTGWVYTGDLLRAGFYVMLFIAAAREVGRYWERVAGSATQEERRRVARELHDGLAQELAFLSTQSRRMEGGSDVDPGLLARTAERALDESRRAIAALTREIDEPLEVTLSQAAEEVASRAGVVIRSDVEPGAPLEPGDREQLVRIVREAVTNAVRHGGAQVVTLVLERRPHLRLVVHDDGCGFDPGAKPRHGFGLVSMRERVEALGGNLNVMSSVGSGTRVEVEVEGL